MPKVYLTEKQRLCAHLSSWVYGEMKVRRISQHKLSKKMGISQQSLSRKLKDGIFNYSDFVFFVKEFQPTEKELLNLLDM